MRIAIIEDEKQQLEYIAHLVEQWQRDNDPSGSFYCFRSGEAFLFNLPDKSFELLIIDILLDGISGMELAKKIREEGCDVMLTFLTGEKEYVFEGYKVQALDYLLKPIRQEELWKLLNKALLKSLSLEPSVILDTSDEILEVPLSKLEYLEVNDHLVSVHVLKQAEKDPVVYSSRISLAEWNKKLKELAGEGVFISPHRSFLVHCGLISRVTKKYVTMHDGTEIPIARGRWQLVTEAYLSYRRRNLR